MKNNYNQKNNKKIQKENTFTEAAYHSGKPGASAERNIGQFFIGFPQFEGFVGRTIINADPFHMLDFGLVR